MGTGAGTTTSMQIDTGTRPGRRRSRRLAATAALAALLGLAAACAPMPPPPQPVDLSTCPAAATGQVQVAVVVLGGAPTSPSIVCVVVPEGSNGLDALAARAQRVGAGAPRLGFGDAFVCGIDGVPAAPACGDSGPDGFSYWSFWTGGAGGWQESLTGAADRTVTQGSVDAWVFGTWDFASTFPAPPGVAADFATLTN
jgi:hypothetical protein